MLANANANNPFQLGGISGPPNTLGPKITQSHQRRPRAAGPASSPSLSDIGLVSLTGGSRRRRSVSANTLDSTDRWRSTVYEPENKKLLGEQECCRLKLKEQERTQEVAAHLRHHQHHRCDPQIRTSAQNSQEKLLKAANGDCCGATANLNQT